MIIVYRICQACSRKFSQQLELGGTLRAVCDRCMRLHRH